MLVKTQGIVLRTIKYSESSLICNIYTKECGMQSYIVSGVRKTNSKISSSLLQLMSLVEIVAYHKQNIKALNRIKEIKPAYVYQELPFKITKSSVGLFIAELTQKSLRDTEVNTDLFDFLYNSFILLDQLPHSAANFHLSFALHFSSFLGFMPQGEYSKDTPFFDIQGGIFVPSKQDLPYFIAPPLTPYFSKLMRASLLDSASIEMDRTTRRLLLDKIVMFYQFHIDNMPNLNAHIILQEIF